MMRFRRLQPKRAAWPADRGAIAGALAAVGIAIAILPAITGADLYLSADRSGILPVNATVITFLSLSSAFFATLFFGLARDRGRGLCSAYLAAAPVLVAFALLMIVQLAGGFLPAAHWHDGGKFIYLPLYGFVVLMFSVGIASAPAFRRHYRLILAACLLAAAGSILVDVFFPETFSKLYTRPAGFMKDPNAGAATVLILTIIAVDWTRSRAGDMLLWLIAGTAVAATLSRGGMILFATAFLYYSLVAARSALQLYAKRLFVLLIGVALLVPLYSMGDLGNTVYSEENRRVQLLAALLYGESAVVTADSRVQLVSDYIDLISERPILGHGSGFAASRHQVSQAQVPHNTFLLLWVENGLPGLAAYLMLLVIAFWHFRGRTDVRGQALCAAFLVFSIFTNNALDKRPLIVALALVSVLAACARSTGAERTRPISARSLAGPFGRRRIGASPSAAPLARWPVGEVINTGT